jgi:chemotaxis protein MotB
MHHLWPRSAVLALSLAAVALAGCGYTKEEYQAQADKLTRALAKQRDAEGRAAEMDAELDRAKQRVIDLEDRLGALGMDLQTKEGKIGEISATLAERERALAEYRAKAKQLEDLKAKMELLRAKLDELSNLGIEVRVRRNRLLISLPGDVLFDTGKDKIRKEGKDALKKIAEVIKADPALVARDYQILGHTDDKKLKGGAFGDNLGLSLARARSVHGFLVDPEGGGLPRERWSAAGYADTDPVGPNDTDEGRQKNRRCEIVVVPAIAEMLDLRQLAAERGPAKKVPPKEPAAEPKTP